MALSAEIIKLLNDFADSQPALRLPTEPYGASNPNLGDALDAAIDAAVSAADDASEIAYTPDADADWETVPATTSAGLDQLAAQRTRLSRMSVGFAALNTAGTGVAALFGTAIPDTAIVKKVWYEVTEAFSGDGDDGSSIKAGLEDQDNDVVASATLASWGAGLADGIQDGAAANMLKLTADRQLAVTWTAGGTDVALDAGQMEVYVEWVPGT